jgi:hypothetical protein
MATMTYTALSFKQPDGSNKSFVQFFDAHVNGHHVAVLIPEEQMAAFLGGDGDIPSFETVEVKGGVYGPIEDDSVLPVLNEMLDQKIREAEETLLDEQTDVFD